MPVAPAALVAGATRAPTPYGLFSVLTWRPGGDRWESGVAWEAGSCEPVGVIGPAACGIPGEVGQPEIQVVTIAGAPTTGTFTLSHKGRTTGQIARNATAQDVEDAINAVAVHQVSVTGSAGGPWTVTSEENAVFDLLTSDDNFDVGGVSITLSQEGEFPGTEGLPKELDSNLSEGLATQFSVYGHFQCSPVGWTPEAASAQATTHLLSREEKAVEQALWSGTFGNTPNLATDVTDVTAATPKAPAVAIGLLEQFIQSTYGSLGIIYLDPVSAEVAAADQVLNIVGGRLTTHMGTPVVVGAFDSVAPGDASALIKASPPLFGYRSDVFYPSNVPGDLLDRATNDLYAVAERSYLLGFDPCGVGSALLSLS